MRRGLKDFFLFHHVKRDESHATDTITVMDTNELYLFLLYCESRRQGRCGPY